MALPPLFSVCVPVYNGETFLIACLESILCQTFKDFEIVIVDDGSSDQSTAIINSFRQRDPRIRYYRNEQNLGLVENWNTCVRKAEGEWIKFLFQDDLMEPYCLSRVSEHVKGNHLIFHGRNFVFSGEVNDTLVGFYSQERVTSNSYLKDITHATVQQIAQIVRSQPGFNFFGEPSSVTFKKSVTEEVGFFNQDLVQLCDYEYWCRISMSFGAQYIADNLSTFRVHGKAASSANLLSRAFRFKFLDKLIIYRSFSIDPLFRNLRKFTSSDLWRKRYADHIEKIIAYLKSLEELEMLEMLAQVRTYTPYALDDLERGLKDKGPVSFLKRLFQ